MHLDVLDLRDFYYRRALGRVVREVLRRRLTTLWPDVRGQTLAGFGFAVPVLRPWLAEARRTIALMPGPQGVVPWPPGRPNVSVLVEETRWPIETGHIDRLIVLHGLETSERPSELLQECWRVLGPGGRVLFIVPNRAGLWARREATPFGFGQPYTAGQLEGRLRLHGFVPERHAAALFMPPSGRRFWMRLAPLAERLGERYGPGLAGGVLIVEASKRVGAAGGRAEKARSARPLGVLAPRPGTATPV